MAFSSARRRPSRRQGILTALVLLVFCACLLTWQHGSLNLGVYRLDLDVYRIGAKAWLDNHDLYGRLPETQGGLPEPFTYPPISAIVMSPLAVVSSTLAGVLMTGVSLALLVCVLALFFRATKLAAGRGTWRLAMTLLPLAVLLEPVRTTLAYGQINIVLMALVACDCLLPSTWFTVRGRKVGWPRGTLTGVAGALKLTPMVFLLYFVARKDWKGCLSVLGGFVTIGLIGFALAPHDSWEYWTKTMFQTGRIGPGVFSGNQSLTGVLDRAHLSGSTETATWLVLSALVAALAFIAVRRLARQGRTVTAVAITACTQLLVSPVSWSHHWVWCAPVLLCALVRGRRLWRWGAGSKYFWITAAVAAVYLSEPQVWFPHTLNREYGWALWEQAIGSAYVWVGVAAVFLVAFGKNPPPAVPARPPAEVSSRPEYAEHESAVAQTGR
ncbi:glycosyltransferase 87 family protein [Actinospica robiniae]|uniref:glycosyltransferase 87 family protein n=1 Tax=Actinospica robiniae TaxID=304901 RepID=UPI0012F7C58B|nr:glycosyltransferase 87 family protein [Actinospica robiniae]